MRENGKIKIALSFVFMLIMFFCFSTKAEAFCSTKKYSNLKMTAYKAAVNYELNFDDDHNYYFKLKVNNVDKDILVRFDGYEYEPEDGYVEIKTRIPGGKTYEIDLYGGYETSCPEEYLYTKRITVPKYNPLSERDECIEYEEFYLCNKWYAGKDATDISFESELNRYIEQLKSKDKDEIPKKPKTFFQTIIDFFINNKIIMMPIAIIISVFIIYRIVVIIIKRRNRIKLNDK